MGISAYDTINYANFNPLSMQEIFTPAAQMREQHDKLQEEYAAQNTQTSLSLLGLKEGIDDEAIKIQKTLIEETRKASDELMTKGFNDAGRRKNIYKLKERYNSEVVPLQNQLKIRQERSDLLYKMQLQNPTYRATFDPNSIGLTAGLKDPNAFNFDGVSGNDLYKSVAEKASQLSKVIEQKHPELIGSKLAYQYFTAVKSGANLSQIDKAMRQQFNPKDVDKMTNLMHGIVSSTLNEFGVPQKFANNQKVQDELWSTASQGLYAAAGQKNFGQMTDQYRMQLDAEKRAKEDAAEAQTKTLFGADVSVIGEEGSIFQDEPLIGMNPLFNEKGQIQLYNSENGPKSAKTYSGNWGSSTMYTKSTKEVEAANQKQQQINKAINWYRKKNNIPISGAGKKTQKEVFELMKYDNQAMKDYMSTSGHKIAPIMDISTSNSILNQAFYTNTNATTFAELGSNYSKDMSSGIGLEAIAKRHDLTTDQITNYIQNSGLRTGFDKTSGLYTVPIPTKMKNVGTSGNPKWVANEGATYKTLGFSYSNSHKAPVYAINAIRQSDNTNSKKITPLSRGTKYDGSSGYFKREVYNPNDKKVYTEYSTDSDGKNIVSRIPYSAMVNGQPYHISGNDYRNESIMRLQQDEVAGTEFKGVQGQTPSLPGVKLN